MAGGYLQPGRVVDDRVGLLPERFSRRHRRALEGFFWFTLSEDRCRGVVVALCSSAVRAELRLTHPRLCGVTRSARLLREHPASGKRPRVVAYRSALLSAHLPCQNPLQFAGFCLLQKGVAGRSNSAGLLLAKPGLADDRAAHLELG